MSSLSEIDDAVQVFKKTGNQNLALLHCNSTYPAYIGDMNLMAIQKLKDYYNIPVGLSDHCENLDAHQKLLLIYGANIIERHFTINKYMEGPDHILSSEIEEMKLLKKFSLEIYNLLKTNKAKNKIKLIKKFTEIKNEKKKSREILGIGLKEIMPTEYETINQQRKSLYAKQKFKERAIY